MTTPYIVNDTGFNYMYKAESTTTGYPVNTTNVNTTNGYSPKY